MNYKHWWESKINWVQFVGIFAQMAVWFGYVVPPGLEEQAAVAAASVQAVVTIVMRTWFTDTPVKQSVE